MVKKVITEAAQIASSVNLNVRDWASLGLSSVLSVRLDITEAAQSANSVSHRQLDR